MKRWNISPLAISAIMIGLTGCQTPSSSTNNLPPLREGFHWEEFHEVGVTVPSPDHWHRAVSKGNGLYTGSISVENYETEGLFKTGFTIQVFTKIKERTGKTPSAHAVEWSQEIEKTPHNTVLAQDPLKERGDVSSSFIRYRNSPINGRKITIHKFFVTLDKIDLLYIYTFESPNETWEESFQNYGIPMMEQIKMGLLSPDI